MIPTKILSRFVRAEERRYPGATGELSDLIVSIALGVKIISQMVASAGIKSLAGYTGETNVHGDKTTNLDREADDVLVQVLGSSDHFGSLVSEERDEIITAPASRPDGKYVVAFDPLDGSSNIGSNIPVGTIFAVFRRKDPSATPSNEDFLQPGNQLVAAGYSVYGAKTTFVYCAGESVHGFTLDHGIGEFVLTNERIRVPQKGTIFSINEGNTCWWDDGVKNFVREIKEGNLTAEKPYSARYVGSLVADFDRTLHRGGIFLYPFDSKRPKGRLRLLYETMPLAFIMERAGGLAYSGATRVLDIVPQGVHEKSAFVAGSPFEVEMFRRIAEASLETGKN